MNIQKKSKAHRAIPQLAVLLCWGLGCSAALAQLTAMVAV